MGFLWFVEPKNNFQRNLSLKRYDWYAFDTPCDVRQAGLLGASSAMRLFCTWVCSTLLQIDMKPNQTRLFEEQAFEGTRELLSGFHVFWQLLVFLPRRWGSVIRRETYHRQAHVDVLCRKVASKPHVCICTVTIMFSPMLYVGIEVCSCLPVALNLC